MRMQGVVRGSSIALFAPPSLPEGQEVEVEIVATESSAQVVEELAAFRARLLDRWGKPYDLSAQMIREDRDR